MNKPTNNTYQLWSFTVHNKHFSLYIPFSFLRASLKLSFTQVHIEVISNFVCNNRSNKALVFSLLMLECRTMNTCLLKLECRTMNHVRWNLLPAICIPSFCHKLNTDTLKMKVLLTCVSISYTTIFCMFQNRVTVQLSKTKVNKSHLPNSCC